MTVDEAKHKMDFLKKAYQKLIDEKVDSGKLIGDGVMGEWKAETPLDEAYKDMIEALEMAIKALEQQPSEDCISREAVISEIDKYIEKAQSTGSRDDFISFQELVVKQLPPVTPKRSTRKWINKGDYAECSNCGANSGVQYNGVEPVPLSTRYCPNCGAKMEVEE